MTGDVDWRPGDPLYPDQQDRPWLACMRCGAATLGPDVEIGLPCPQCGAPLSQRLTTDQMNEMQARIRTTGKGINTS